MIYNTTNITNQKTNNTQEMINYFFLQILFTLSLIFLFLSPNLLQIEVSLAVCLAFCLIFLFFLLDFQKEACIETNHQNDLIYYGEY